MKNKFCKMFMVLFGTILSILIFCSCTENQRTRTLGGSMTIDLPKGERLMMATWKDEDLFYLTEPMPSDYKPTKKTFREYSSFGIIESTVYFVEHR